MIVVAHLRTLPIKNLLSRAFIDDSICIHTAVLPDRLTLPCLLLYWRAKRGHSFTSCIAPCDYVRCLVINKNRLYTLCELKLRGLKETKVDPSVVKIEHKKNITIPNIKFYIFVLKINAFI